MRRAWYGPVLPESVPGRHRVDELTLNADAASPFRPSLRPDVDVGPGLLKRAPFEVEIDAFDQQVLQLCDGERSVVDLVIEMEQWSEAADELRDRILSLLATLGSLDMLVTGEQS